MNDANPVEHQSALQPSGSYKVIAIGETKTPLITIDNFSPEPDALCKAAIEGENFKNNDKDFYPGIRKVFLNAEYRNFFQKKILSIIYQHFPHTSDKSIADFHSVFSITTTPAERLRPIQTIPHIDTHDRLSFACVHYLCEPPFRGTSFYRHIRTGLERIENHHLTSYFAMVKKQLMSRDFVPAYCNNSSDLFERIYHCDLKFNRLVLYPANLLHSGDIDASLMNQSSINQSHYTNERLTLNTFISFSAEHYGI